MLLKRNKMMRKEIVEQIQRIAEAQGCVPGSQKFKNITGIAKHVWYGVYWTRWGDALIEAGFSPNTFKHALDKDALIRTYLEMVDELGRVPSDGDIRLKSRNRPDFPGHSTFRNRLGRKNDLLRKVIKYANANQYSKRKIALLESALIEEKAPPEPSGFAEYSPGFVYLMKSGKYYKIGRTNSPDRRRYEIRLQLPEAIQPIHSITTDDPSGIEAYWHNRFKEKRLNGEWFTLSARDVCIFRKRKFM